MMQTSNTRTLVCCLLAVWGALPQGASAQGTNQALVAVQIARGCAPNPPPPSSVGIGVDAQEIIVQCMTAVADAMKTIPLPSSATSDSTICAKLGDLSKPECSKTATADLLAPAKLLCNVVATQCAVDVSQGLAGQAATLQNALATNDLATVKSSVKTQVAAFKAAREGDLKALISSDGPTAAQISQHVASLKAANPAVAAAVPARLYEAAAAKEEPKTTPFNFFTGILVGAASASAVMAFVVYRSKSTSSRSIQLPQEDKAASDHELLEDGIQE